MLDSNPHHGLVATSGVRPRMAASQGEVSAGNPRKSNAVVPLTSSRTDATYTGACDPPPVFLSPPDSDTTVNARSTHTTLPVPRISSPDRLRMKTYRLQQELQEFLLRHGARHERLQDIRARRALSRGSRTGSCLPSGDSLSSGSRLSEKKTERMKLPNLKKCFEEARTNYLLESERRRKNRAIPPVYSSNIPSGMGDVSHLQNRDMLGNPDSFGLRFFSPPHLQESSLQHRDM